MFPKVIHCEFEERVKLKRQVKMIPLLVGARKKIGPVIRQKTIGQNPWKNGANVTRQTTLKDYSEKALRVGGATNFCLLVIFFFLFQVSTLKFAKQWRKSVIGLELWGDEENEKQALFIKTDSSLQLMEFSHKLPSAFSDLLEFFLNSLSWK